MLKQLPNRRAFDLLVEIENAQRSSGGDGLRKAVQWPDHINLGINSADPGLLPGMAIGNFGCRQAMPMHNVLEAVDITPGVSPQDEEKHADRSQQRDRKKRSAHGRSVRLLSKRRQDAE
ncbi:hypothetical protein GCM10009424_28750 [Sphingomonas ursincola]